MSMNEEHRATGTGWPETAAPRIPLAGAAPQRAPDTTAQTGVDGVSAADGVSAVDRGRRPDAPGTAGPRRRLTTAGVLIGVLLALFGFTLVVQLRSNATDEGLAAARQEDLVRILSDLEAREQRLRRDIAALEDSQRQLTSGVQGRQAAQEEAARRADELGVLAGTLPARGQGLTVELSRGAKPIEASAILNAVQELRGAGAEAMQIAGADGTAVRVVASSYFLDDDGAVVVDGVRLSGPYRLTVIGEPNTMRTALNIHGGVAESVEKDGGNVIVQEGEVVDVTALHKATSPQYARPVS